MPKPILTISIVSYNTQRLTLETLDSVISSIGSSPLAKKIIEVIVVDNHSQDQSVIALKKFKRHLTSTHPNIKLYIISNQTNLGFATANNQAIKKATGKYLLLLNSDTIVQDQALYQLLTDYQNLEKRGSSIKILAAKLLNADGSYQNQGGALPNLLTLAIHMFFFKNIPWLGSFLPSTQEKININKNQPRILTRGWVGATAMLFAKSLYNQLGPLDENIFMYGEDTEYCLRAHQFHYQSAIDLSAEIIHLGSQSSTASRALIGEMKTLLYLFKKYLPPWQLPVAYLILQIGCLLRMFIFGGLLLDRGKLKTYYQTWLDLKKRYNELQ